MKQSRLTADRLRQLFAYNPNDGHFYRRIRGKNWRRSGNPSFEENGTILGRQAGCVRGTLPRRAIMIDGKNYSVSRLAFLYVFGEFPPHEIDHINGDPKDNRWSNLRSATRAQNERNKGLTKRNKSGFKGTSWDVVNKKWRATITHEKRAINLGRFDNIEEAYLAYCEAARRLHGEFARLK